MAAEPSLLPYSNLASRRLGSPLTEFSQPRSNAHCICQLLAKSTAAALRQVEVQVIAVCFVCFWPKDGGEDATRTLMQLAEKDLGLAIGLRVRIGERLRIAASGFCSGNQLRLGAQVTSGRPHAVSTSMIRPSWTVTAETSKALAKACSLCLC
jgi:hypothetical protein